MQAAVLLAHGASAISAAVIERSDTASKSEPFVATDEFKVIEDGQAIPAGLYVKFDMTTGKRMAKKMPKHEDSTATPANYELTVPKEIQDDIDRQDAAKMSIDNKLHSSNDKKVEKVRVASQGRAASSSSSSDKCRCKEQHSKLSETLDRLQDLVDDLDNGYDFAGGDGIPQMFKLLEASWPRDLRRKAAIIIGEALGNNPEAQKAAQSHHVATRLLEFLEKEQDDEVISRLLYALSSATRGDRIAHDAFYNANGFITLMKAYQRVNEINIRGKALSLFIDLLNPDMQVEENDKANKSNAKPTHRGLGDWCQALKSTLDISTTSVDFQLDFVRAFVALKEEEVKNNEKLCQVDATLTNYFNTQFNMVEHKCINQTMKINQNCLDYCKMHEDYIVNDYNKVR
ncbi:hypothetical protein BDF22DRAFT_741734 [Syncephalis plumigaleata]|nr:hypothetical protein BDF22DRAFT_741734 [Syncephalis plumigaleata]